MMRNAKAMTDYMVEGRDGEAGRVRQLYFDDETWTVRYLVVQTGSWLSGRQILVSPISVTRIDDRRHIVSVNLNKDKLAGIPALNINRPVSRRYEARYHSYFGWPAYWGGQHRWGDDRYPSGLFTAEPIIAPALRLEDLRRDTLLRSSAEVNGFSVVSGDETLGAVDDLILDDTSWAVAYAVVNADTLAPGRKLLVSPHWIDEISVSERMIVTDIAPDAAKNAPPFDPAQGPTRDYEMMLFRHYGRVREIDALRKPRAAVEV